MRDHVQAALNTYRRDCERRGGPSFIVRHGVEQRKKLANVVKYSKLLSENLVGITDHYPIESRFPIRATLDALAADAEQARARIATANKGASKDPAFHDLLVNLTIAWSREFPKGTRIPHGVTRRGATEDYHGPLLDFVRKILDDEKIEHRNLGGRLYNLDLPWRKRPRQTR
jgi:hypothetical protein